jgi:predicted nucleic acid-binding protein
MAGRTDAYVDTSALIAFADRSDSNNALFRRLFSQPPALVTTTLVVAEGHAWFLRRYDRGRALRFMALIEDMTPLSVVAVGRDEQDAAVKLMRRFSDQDLTLVDAVGLYLMGARRIRACWSTDFHLGLTGVPLVINQR